jgi:hypothetical protein
MRETAEALGKSLLTIRSWIEKGFIPAPVCAESQQEYLQYTVYELTALASVLSEHAQSSKYISAKDQSLITRIHDAVEVARIEFLGF